METELIPGLPDCVALHCLLLLPFHAILAARAVCRRWKHELSSPSFYRIRRAAHVARPIVAMLLRGKLFPTVGVLHIALYEPATGVFTMRQLAANRPNDKMGCSNIAMVVGRELVVVGGWDEFALRCLCEVHIYDLLSGAWRPGAPMPVSDWSFYMCGIQRGKLLVIGRRNEENKNLWSALAYDVATDIWLELPEMTMQGLGQDTRQGTSRDGSFCDKFWRNRKEYNAAIRWYKELLLNELVEELSVSTSAAGEEVKISMHFPQEKSKEKAEVEIVTLRGDTLETLRRRLGLLPADEIDEYLISSTLELL